jgi:hypothetical protein
LWEGDGGTATVGLLVSEIKQNNFLLRFSWIDNCKSAFSDEWHLLRDCVHSILRTILQVLIQIQHLLKVSAEIRTSELWNRKRVIYQMEYAASQFVIVFFIMGQF